MKNNFVAKHAQRSGAGFHSDKNKPDRQHDDRLYHCRDCHSFDTFTGDEELVCERCGSKKLTCIENNA